MQDLEDLCIKDNLENFEYIKSDILDLNLENSFVQKELIFKRIFDNKFFKIEYQENSYFNLSYNKFPIIAIEVFPKTITKIIYE